MQRLRGNCIQLIKQPHGLQPRLQSLSGFNIPVRSIMASVDRTYERQIIRFLLLHIPLALILRTVPGIATVHALVVLALGLKWAIAPNTVVRAIYTIGYIVGSDVLWRMTWAGVFWEYGKYAISLLIIIVLFRYPYRKFGISVVYFMSLLVSVPATIDYLGITKDARREISFNLSGPFSLALSVLLFSQLKMKRSEVRSLLWTTLAPIIGVATLAAYGILDRSAIAFTNESNFATSGGFGPNQVSNVLGMGALLSFVISLMEPNRNLRWISIFLCMWCLTQCLLTLSRGGALGTVLCIVLIAIHYIARPRVRHLLIGTLLAIISAFGLLIIPRLQSFTGGMLETRWSSIIPGLEAAPGYTSDVNVTSGRNTIARMEEQLWKENFWLGVGPGIAKHERYRRHGELAAAHTEFTRLMAEHGLVGMLGLGTLVLNVFYRYFRQRDTVARGLMAGLTAWGFLGMIHSAMRIAAFSFIIGLALIRWDVQPNSRNSRT